MLRDIVAVQPLEDYRLRLRFDHGQEGVVDIAQHVAFTGVFEPLRDIEYFRQVRVNPDIGTICWPNEADLAPEVLYAIVVGQPYPDLELA